MNKIFQHGTLELIMAGLYDGTLSFSELLENGDDGIGTTHGLDGEVRSEEHTSELQSR